MTNSPKTRTVNHPDERTTREMILRSSLELINERGMIDFRIDTLARSIDLSPGNITYHFSRKEDICVTLWEQYLAEYKSVTRAMTTLLDIKQLYLLNRISIELNYKYRGVVLFRNADLGAINRDKESGRMNENAHILIARRVLELLGMNGYLKSGLPEYILEATGLYHFILMRWSLNFAYISCKPGEVAGKLDYLALLSLHALYPVFGKKGEEEFHAIAKTVLSGKLLSGSKDPGFKVFEQQLPAK